MSKLRRFIIASIVILLLPACQGTYSALVDDSTCDPPCWRDITPGVTNKDAAINIIQDMPDVDTDSLRNELTFQEDLSESLTWRFTGTGEYSGGLYLHDQTVLVSFWTYQFRIDLERLINRYGDPSHVFITATKFEMIYLTINIIYDESGICIKHNTSLLPFVNDNEYRVRPSMDVSYVYFIDPSIKDGQLQMGCLEGFPVELFGTNRQAWEGYGIYKVLTDW